ncbi:MAG: HAD-IA family hydrolase [Chloroflexota bacterium]
MNPSFEPRAIIFDLYGTLIYEPDLESCYPALADAIGVDLAEYRRARQATVPDSMVGRLPTVVARARAILAELGRPIDDSLATDLAETERRARWATVRIYPTTLSTLRTLHARGLPLGLVSDCTAIMGRPIPERFGLLALLDAVALSYEVGSAKPSPAIYHRVTDALGVPPESCLYVGDGGSDELNGATALGMRTARIDQEGAYGRAALPASSDFVIARLDELLEIPPLNGGRPGFPHLDVSWLRPNLAIGGRVDPINVPRLATLGIGGVVDLRAEESDDLALLARHGMRFLHLPMLDCHPLTGEQMREGSRWVAEQNAAGRNVLIHCHHGVGRSVMLAAAVLIREGATVDDALAWIKSRRPRMAPSEDQLAAIKDFSTNILPHP